MSTKPMTSEPKGSKSMKMIRRTYEPNDPALRMLLSQSGRNKKILSVFFKYDEGPPRTLTTVELLMRA